MSQPSDETKGLAPSLDLSTTRAFAGVGVLTEVPRPADSANGAVLQALERIAVALEGPRGEPSPIVVRMPELQEVRTAISERDWSKAVSLLDALSEHPERDRLGSELSAARSVAAEDLRGQLAVAREVNDPERVLLIHDELAILLDSENLREVQQESVKWFLKLIMRRMRTGTVRVDVAELATRVADRSGSTLEGASLRASLPTIRRSAGLCPRCGVPYAGLGDSCPQCVMATAANQIPDPLVEEESDDE